jgi:lipid-A-disaccharide synthase
VTAGPSEFILTTNGPGELCTWVAPVLSELRRRAPESRIVVSLVPCQFASGNEAAVAREMGADAVTEVSEHLRLLATGRRPPAYSGRGGAVLKLGGEVFHAARIAASLKYPVYSYAFEPEWSPKLVRLFVDSPKTQERALARGADPARVQVIGNLVADAFDRSPGRPRETVLLLVPGSRGFEAVHLLGAFLAAARHVAEAVAGLEVVWLRSPLLTPRQVDEAIAGSKSRVIGGVGARREGDRLVTEDGLEVRIAEGAARYPEMTRASLAIAVPGTNTLELALAGVPALVVLPTQRPELIPIPGPAQFIGLIPLLGPAIKRAGVRALLPRYPFAALPNIIAGREIVPELRGEITAREIGEAAAALAADFERLEEIRAALAAEMPPAGAASRLVETLLSGA